jgi:DNA-directed RNA polymerase subunit RPC12/RpoP
MSEIKFACSHCSQHIGCDDGYCGEKIDCPGCGTRIVIPPRSAFIPMRSASLKLTLPVASRERQYPRPATLEVWTEEKWERHAEAAGSYSHLWLLPVWILFLLPFAVAFVLIMHGARVPGSWFIFVLFALVSGFYISLTRGNSTMEVVLKGLMYSVAMLFLYMVLATGLFFFGCALLVGGLAGH